MLMKLAQKIYNALDFTTAEIYYRPQIDKLKSDLQNTRQALGTEREDSYTMMIENQRLEAELEDAKSELKDSQSAYSSLLKDYYEMMDRHREFKRESLAKIEELQNQILEVSI